MSAVNRTKGLLVLFLLALLLIACGENDHKASSTRTGLETDYLSSTSQAETYPIDPLFADFYDRLGGEGVVGPAISHVLEMDGLKQQYVEAGLMLLDERATLSDRFRLAPLARDFSLPIAPTVTVDEPGGISVGGYLIHPAFFAMYKQLGGAQIVGLPLGEAQYNAVKGRVEQYFENLGYYYLVDDPARKVRLLAYGAFACDQDCRFNSPQDSIPSRDILLTEPYVSKAQSIGYARTGPLLEGPHVGMDGKQEVIFENLVLMMDETVPGGITAKPIVEMLGFRPHPLENPSKNPLMVFYEIKDGKGYNVPRYFDDFIKKHGDITLSGLPISEVFTLDRKVFQQCFTNLCLEYELNTDKKDKLRLTPLGSKYKTMIFVRDLDFVKSLSMEKVEMKLGESQDRISSNKSQEVYVLVLEGNTPLKYREPILFLKMPDGSTKKFYFPPTDQDGRTSIRLMPIKAPSGTLITYRVCLYGLNGQEKCEGDNYMIWNFN